jgi:hypothetical protein
MSRNSRVIFSYEAMVSGSSGATSLLKVVFLSLINAINAVRSSSMDFGAVGDGSGVGWLPI